MTRKLVAAVTTLALVALAFSLVPTASAAHNCPIEDLSWTGVGERPMNHALRTADAVCDGYHGGYCDGKYLDYGWYGLICI